MHTILYIEDSSLNRHLVRRYFKRTDIQLIEAETGKEGIKLAKAYRPELILLDYHLPDIDGRMVAGELRNLPEVSDTPIIGLTADETYILHRQMLTEGFDEVLTKPISVNGLLHSIERYLSFNVVDIA